MTIEEIREKIKTTEYDFLRDNEHLGSNIILLGLGGSHSYGTNNDASDLDVRGCILNKREEILTANYYDQFVEEKTDTVIYSFNKLINLLSNVNPNTIELLGLKKEHYLHISPIGQELLDNKKMFLSKKAVHSFGGYANQQLYRLQQKSASQLKQKDLEEHILKTLSHMKTDFSSKYSAVPGDAMNLYIDKSVQEGFDTEIFMDVKLTHYPLRDYCSMWNELQNTVKAYARVGCRNEKALTHNKIGKHSMHLIRLYYMCLDLLEKEEIVTYREKEHDLLMDIRNGVYLNEDGKPNKEFFEMVNDLEKRLEYAKENTSLPEQPDTKRINEFVISVNERVVKGLI